MTAPRPLRAAFIGGSTRSAVGYAHYAAVRMDGRFDLVAGCFSRDAATNAATAEAYGVPAAHIHHDWRALSDMPLDAVIVLTPTPTHAEIVSHYLAAGVPVVCEKAMVRSSAEAAQLLELNTQVNGFLAVTYNYSGYPMVRQLRRFIRDGVLGRIVQIHAEMPQEGFIRRVDGRPAATPQAWRLEDGATPTLHLDLAVHLHQLVYYTTGLKPVEVTAMQDRFGAFPQVADNVIALARYDNNAAAQYWFSKSALGHRNGLRLRIYGEKAAAEWLQCEPETLTLSHADGRREIIDRAAGAPVAAEARYTRFKAGHPAGYVEAFANLYADIADALTAHREGRAFTSDEVFGAELALEGAHFLEAMVDAASAKAWRRVPGQTHQAKQRRAA